MVRGGAEGIEVGSWDSDGRERGEKLCEVGKEEKVDAAVVMHLWASSCRGRQYEASYVEEGIWSVAVRLELD